jgi:hypothetical protein
MLSWDEAKKDWVKNSCLTYKYYKNGYNVEVRHWNAEKQQYELPQDGDSLPFGSSQPDHSEDL